MAILFQSLKVITEEKIQDPADYLYDGITIQKVPTGYSAGKLDILDCENFLGSKGWIDLRCFAGEPGLEHRETLETLGESLKKGGFTEAVILPNTCPAIQSKNEVAYIQNKVKGLFSTIHVQAAITKDTGGEDFTEMLDLFHHGVSIFGDGLVPLANSDRMMKALQYLQKFNGILFDHSYDPLLSLFGHMHEGYSSTRIGMKGIPSLAEEVAVQKNLEILRYTGGAIHFQAISTIGAVEHIRKAKAEGLSVSADVSLYQLLFKDGDLADFDTTLKVMPPFRGNEERSALIEGLKDGSIDAIVSNHIPQDFDAKHMEFDLAPLGMAGLQTFLCGMVKLENELGWPLLIKKITHGPGKIIRKKDRGWDSLTVFDPKEEWKFDNRSNVSLASNSPWFKSSLTGKIKYMVNRGKFEKIDG